MSLIKEPTKGKTLKIPHFPTDFQALIFRLWDMVPCEKIAEVLKTSAINIQKCAEDMGLSRQGNTDVWLERGYISILKAVWNLLPYEQIYKLLNWNEERLEYVLKEEDFLWVKLGEKGECESVYYRELSAGEIIQTRKIKETYLREITPFECEKHTAEFDFFGNKNTLVTDKSKKEITVDSTWAIEFSNNDEIKIYVDDFKKFALKYGINFTEKSDRKISLRLDAKIDDEEYREINIENNLIDINAAHTLGILRGLYDIKNLVEKSGSFTFDKQKKTYRTKVKTRIVYPFCALYADILDKDINISFPDEMLEEYAKRGINGLWFQGILYKILPYPFDESVSEGWQARLARLKAITEKCERYGIKIYMYINEPRDMPLSFFEKYPHLKGASQKPGVACLCSSHPETHKYLRDALQMLCREVPKIGGFINITQSENCVLCYSRGVDKSRYAHIKTEECPVCKDKKASEVTASIIKTMADAVSEVDDKIKFFEFTWAWQNDFCDQYEELLDLLPQNVIALQVSEDKIPFTRGGIESEVADYSISIVGPGKTAKKLWEKAKANGVDIAAKVQINTSWECSTAPFLPVYENVIAHMKNLTDFGVEHMMLSWTLGGYMSDNIKIASSFFFDCGDDNFYDSFLKMEYGDHSENIKKAVKCFCEGLSEYPFSHQSIYEGPSNTGAGNLLFPEKTGFSSTMTGFTYDDLDRWRNVYPRDVFYRQYKKVCEKWEEGLEFIKNMPICDFYDMAFYGYTLFKASENQILYYILRDSGTDKKEIREVVKSEKELALRALEIMLRNSSIGFEATNHYYVTKAMLREKIIQCDYLLSEIY